MCPILSYQNIATLTPVYEIPRSLPGRKSNQNLILEQDSYYIEPHIEHLRKKNHFLTNSLLCSYLYSLYNSFTSKCGCSRCQKLSLKKPEMDLVCVTDYVTNEP